ncbi:hypothetical protein BJI67_07585 [Acidihalobacter aeolianus]|uniref:JmjC domain-containing protein n=1 Tax=Acidihalobacter aeolianus TaxID=2792603 RepID=A0A1D8K7M8_9GAMM|nr:cupin domain-containing protein [Acidihalobacter aeolianus]AOV16946.1 hypothetical protein BJI67_07585 [Acidihalobacter aeolianus]
MIPGRLLGGLSADEFLRDYWQRRPLLVRGAFEDVAPPLEPDEFAGLALEPDVPARLVVQHGERHWELRHGPFEESDFAALPETHWTLLITDLEKFVPPLQTLVEPFRFLPDWRIDDLMISYAAPQGSVGPHTDAYDVFLLQLAGRRRWQIDTRPVSPDNRLPDQDLRILAHFEAESEWVLEPGDMLYLPPGVAHYGVALDECMTASIGFRAPSQRDLVSAWLDDVVAGLDPERRYDDPGRPSAASSPGEIDSASRKRLVALLREAVGRSDSDLERWLGCYLTEPRADLASLYPPPCSDAEDTLSQHLAAGLGLMRNTAARLAYFSSADTVYFYADGEERTLDLNFQSLLAVLCLRYEYPAELCRDWFEEYPGAHALLADLLRRGVLEMPDEPDDDEIRQESGKSE